MNNLSIKKGLLALITTGFVISMGGVAIAGSNKAGKMDYTSMSPEELADYLIFEKKGFKLDAKIQEGGTIRDRLKQDEIMKTCSGLKGRQIDGATAGKVTKLAKKNIVYPKGGIKLGDWKKGEAVAHNAFGFRVGHKTDKHGKRQPGGMCINCHEMDPKSRIPAGNVGPSLKGYGKIRGQSEAMLKYTYNVIYNPHSTFPCSKMPRIGANGVITEQQILDVMAYLLDPKSPVNK